MNGRMLSGILLIGMPFLISLDAAATWMSPDEEVPAQRLIDNIKAYLEKNPDDADALFTLGRVYSFVYATGTDKFEVYKNFEPYWEPALYGTRNPGTEKPGPGDAMDDRLKLLVESIRSYRAAIEKKPDDLVYLTGLGYVYAAAASHAEQIVWPCNGTAFDDRVKEKGKEKRFWEDLALEAYRKAFALDTNRKRGVAMSIAEEAGYGILGILQQRPDASEEEKKEIRRMKRAVSAMRLGPHMITPIVFSFNGAPLSSLLPRSKQVAFDLDGSGRDIRWDWVQPGTALLAWDPQHKGEITSGRQLFGSAAWWMFWKNGFAALAALDDNGNGWLEGAELDGIAVWHDRNGNAVSEKGEVTPVQSCGIAGINTRPSGESMGMPASRNGLRFADGRYTATYDWIATGMLD